MPNFDNISDSFFDDLFGYSKKKKTIEEPQEKQVELAKVDVSGKTEDTNKTLHYIKAESESKTIKSSNILISSYTIEKIKIPFNFYSEFYLRAKKYFYEESVFPTNYVDFYSYRPQYSQLLEPQFKYYIYWRTMLRKGQYIKTNESYIDLFLNELLNLTGTLISKEVGMMHVCDILNQYYKRGSGLNYNTLIRFIVDYSLYFDTPIQLERLVDVKDIVFNVQNYKEFFIGSNKEASKENISDLIKVYSSYDYEKSKFVTNDNKEKIKNHMNAAMILCFNKLFSDIEKETITKEKRELYSFSSQIVCEGCKIHILLDMANITTLTSGSISFLISNCIRYTENWLRKLAKVNSRLTIKDMDDEYATLINHYFEGLLKKNPTTFEKKPEYEKLYDAESEGINLVVANQIENVSWDNTIKLIPEEDLFEEDTTVQEEITTVGLSASALKYLSDITNSIKGNLSNSEIDSLVNQINTYFLESDIGDIILEQNESGYQVIPDYIDEVKEWLNQNLTK